MFTGASSFEQDLCGWDADITAACSGGALCGNSDDGLTCV